MIKLFKASVLFCLFSFNAYSNIIILGEIEKGDTLSISYYKPFKGFANGYVKTIYDQKAINNFSFEFNIDSPIMIGFAFDHEAVIFLCEPNDTIRLNISSPSKNPDNWISIKGNNALGHLYYNTKYNDIPIEKFYPLREVFASNYNNQVSLLIDQIEEEINSQTYWVDSLYEKDAITENYLQYMKTEIRSTLAGEVVSLCKQYSRRKSDSAFKVKSSKIKRELFKVVDPLDYKLLKCRAASSYLYQYFEEMYSKKTDIEQAEVILPESSFYAYAPEDLQAFLWGNALYANERFTPNKNYCEIFKKYKNRFEDIGYNEYFEKLDLCKPVEKQEYKILPEFDADLFNTISFNFPKKRVFIDIWATWCAPCIMEFRNYDADMYDLMDKNKIQLLYISIDKASQKEKWVKDIERLNLKGNHILAGEKLVESIKEVIYDDDHMVIPRYLLVDENGIFLSDDFKRPSHASFKEDIKKYFN